MCMLHSAVLLWEEECQDSPVMELPHSELMPLLDGEMLDRLVPIKNRSATRMNFNGHVILAANEPLHRLCRGRAQSTKEAIITRVIIIEFPYRLGLGGGVPPFRLKSVG